MTKEELQDIKEWVARGWGLSIEESLKLINEYEQLKQEVEHLKEQLQQTQVKMERYEKALKDMLNPDEMLLWLSKNKQENVADYYHFKAKKALED